MKVNKSGCSLIYKNLLIVIIFLYSQNIWAQNTVEVKGKIYDIITQYPIEGADIQLSILQNGKIDTNIQTNKDGEFTIKIDPTNTYNLKINSLGYLKQTIKIDKNSKHALTVYLEPKTISLQAVTIKRKADDKALWIMKNVIKNKTKNYQVSDKQYNYLAYNKIGLFVAGFKTAATKKSKLFKDIDSIVLKNEKLKYKDGYLIPILLSETLNKKYIYNAKNLSYTELISYNISGIGIQDEEAVAQFMDADNVIGVDFSQNNVQLFKKYFVSPLNNTWNLIYNVSINRDNILIGKDKYVELYIYPKHEESAAFRGTILIRYKDYALIKADLSMPKETNINFVKSFTIKQNFDDAGYGLMPQQTEIELELTSDITNAIDGGKLIVKNTTINQRYEDQKPLLEDNFYTKIRANKAIKTTDVSYWNKYSNDQNSNNNNLYETINKINNLKKVKLITYIAQIVNQGYVSSKALALSDILAFLAYNNVEGIRPQLGLRTTKFFSKNVILAASMGYGFLDKQIKGSIFNQLILNRAPYMSISLSANKELLGTNLLGDNIYSLSSSAPIVSRIYKILSKWGDLYSKRPMDVASLNLSIEKDITNSIAAEIGFKQAHMSYIGKIDNRIYKVDPFNTSELLLQVKFNPAKHVRTDENREISFKRYDTPQIRLWTIFGSQNMFTSPNSYQKINLNIFQRSLKVLFLGTAEYDINVGYINGNLPYPLLRTHIGNSSFFLFKRALSTVNESQLISDKYISLSYYHKFDAPLYDYIPIVHQIRKYLKLDLVGSASIVWGSLSKANTNLLNKMTECSPYYFGKNLQALDIKKPFLEMGIGLTNIIEIFRIDFSRRMTYQDMPGASLWRILISMDISF